jgi:ABC-type nitrate/sulfonate/bicarbonate transport system substrate-binding protein
MAARLSAQAIRLALISEGTSAWLLYVAQAKKRFEHEGITVEVTLTGSSEMQLEQLIEGGFDIGFQQSDHVVRAVENGSDLFAFMAYARAPELSLVVAPGIGSLDALRGKVIAVDGSRTGYAPLLRRLLADRGLKDGDYTFKEFGGSKERFDALKSGTAFASLLNPPFDHNLFVDGFKSLGTSMDFFPTYPGPIGATRRSWARQNERRLIAFIRAFDASQAWIKDTSNKKEAINILTARLDIDANGAASAYDAFIKRPPPEITPEGMRQVIDMVWDVEVYKGAKGGPDKYMDLSYKRKALR